MKYFHKYTVGYYKKTTIWKQILIKGHKRDDFHSKPQHLYAQL